MSPSRILALSLLVVMATICWAEQAATATESPPQQQRFHCCGVEFNVTGNLSLSEAVCAYLDRTNYPEQCNPFDRAYEKFIRFKELNKHSNFTEMRLGFRGDIPIIVSRYAGAEPDAEIELLIPASLNDALKNATDIDIGILLTYRFKLPPPHHPSLARMPEDLRKFYKEFNEPKAETKPATSTASQHQKSEL